MELSHSQLCPGIAVMTTEFLLGHPGFRGAILPGHSTSLARVVKTMSEIHGIDISKQPTMAYRTIRQAKNQNQIDPVAEYGRLRSYLREFGRKTLAHGTEGYELIKAKIASKYPAGISKVVAEKVVEEHVWSYLCSIHLTDWCVVGNMKATAEETK
ncbi:hypothetical protein F442_22209 [Phytophthora nicotianae P10297]|uniref:Uncharacterized protein n=1 Tax=Phytophthora nicotianae P10297 TaxID=1317064 RepID=W2Y2S1_PHYNI|nr:hypothetical protein F442_22209 [Phytophthora nicotianae P10297]